MGPTRVGSVTAQLNKILKHIYTKPVTWKTKGTGTYTKKFANGVNAYVRVGAIESPTRVVVHKNGIAVKENIRPYWLENWKYVRDIAYVDPASLIAGKSGHADNDIAPFSFGSETIDLDPEQYAKKLLAQYTANV